MPKRLLLPCNTALALDPAAFESFLLDVGESQSRPGNAADLPSGRGADQRSAVPNLMAAAYLNVEQQTSSYWPTVVGRSSILPCWGVQMARDYEQFATWLAAAIAAPDVDEIVLKICSPGGQMYGAFELADMVFKARGQKRLIAWAVNGPMTSAAYLIGSACDQVYATSSAQLGSIGVMFLHSEYSRQNEASGKTVTILRCPDLKGLGNDSEPLTDEAQQALITTVVDPGYRGMVERIARNRGVSADNVMQTYGRGLAIPAEQALAAGMIDGIRDWNDYLGVLTGTRQLTGPAPVSLRMEAPPMMNFSPETKAVLFAAGVLTSLTASDEVCLAASTAWCAAGRQPLPETEDKLVALVRESLTKPAVSALAPVVATLQPAVGLTAADVQAAALAAVAAEHGRQGELRSRAELLGVDVADTGLLAALADPKVTPSTFTEMVLTKARQEQRPVGRVESGPAALDKFMGAAETVVLSMCARDLVDVVRTEGGNTAAAQQKLTQLTAANPHVRDLAGMPFFEIARECVRLAGRTPTMRNDPEEWAKAFLSMGATGERRFAMGHPGIDGGLWGSMPFSGAGDYPNLMDGIANKIVTFALTQAVTTYDKWASRLDDMVDFNPRQILVLAGITEPDLHVDGHTVNQVKFSESKSWIQRDEYSNGLKLSPRMVINGQLSQFTRALALVQIGHERRINRLCVDLLVNNVTCPIDSTALFHANHANQIAGGSGGGPSIAQNKTMRKKISEQILPGDTVQAGLAWKYALHGSEWINEAEIAYLSPYANYPSITEGSVNQFAGRITPLYEPLIGTSKVWYGIADAALLYGAVYAFGAGYGPGGKRVTYFDPATGCQSFDFYGSFGSALIHYQPFAQNAGQ